MSILSTTMPALALAFALPVAASAATFEAEFWDESSPIASLSEAVAIIDSRDADSVFTTEAIDYPIGPDTITQSSDSLEGYLGTNADTLAGNGQFGLKESVFRFTGMLDLAAGEQAFTVGSDDGFRLTIGGQVISSFEGLRAFDETTVVADAGTGATEFELIYFENDGATGVEFRVDDALASAFDATTIAPIPLPAGLPLMLGALGVFAAVRRKS